MNDRSVPLPPSIKAIEERKTLRTIRLQGRIDVRGAEALQQFIPLFRKQPGFTFKNMILDFKDVTYTDSAGVAQLVKSWFDYKRAEHRVGLVNLGEGPRSMLEVMKLDKVIRIYPDEAAAVRDLEDNLP